MAINIRERIGGVFKKSGKGEVARREEKGREAVVNELRQGYNQLVDTMQAVRGHMEDQSRRSDRVMEVIEALPEVLRTIPETARQQNETLHGLAQNLQAQNRSTGELTQALSGLAQATKQQEQALAGMHDRLNDTLTRGEDSQRAMVSGIDQMSSAINGVTRDQQDGRAVISQVAEQTRRQQKQMVAMNGVSWALAVLALGVAGWVAVTVVQNGAAPITGRPDAAPASTAADDTVQDADATPGTPEAAQEPADETPIEPDEEELVTEEPELENPVTLPTPDPLELSVYPSHDWLSPVEKGTDNPFSRALELALED